MILLEFGRTVDPEYEPIDGGCRSLLFSNFEPINSTLSMQQIWRRKYLKFLMDIKETKVIISRSMLQCAKALANL